MVKIEPLKIAKIEPLKIAILDDHLLLVIAPATTRLEHLNAMSEKLRHDLPGWHALVFRGPAEVVDLRSDPEAGKLGSELVAKVEAALAEVSTGD